MILHIAESCSNSGDYCRRHGLLTVVSFELVQSHGRRSPPGHRHLTSTLHAWFGALSLAQIDDIQAFWPIWLIISLTHSGHFFFCSARTHDRPSTSWSKYVCQNIVVGALLIPLRCTWWLSAWSPESLLGNATSTIELLVYIFHGPIFTVQWCLPV